MSTASDIFGSVFGYVFGSAFGSSEAESEEIQSLYEHARNALPRWLTTGVKSTQEWLWGFVEVFNAVYTQGRAWLDITYITKATGTDLDQHALDRGTVRRLGESDISLRLRLIQITDVITEPALKASIDAVLAANTLGPCTFVNLRRDRGHYHSTGFSRAFYSRGYRMSGTNRPMGYVVILPYGTTAVIGQGVQEYLRQYGPSGFNYFVEIRANP